VLADLSDIDAIITDPPYGRKFLPLLGDLAAWSDRVLSKDGILAVLMGHLYLPEVYRLLSEGRPYRWTACLVLPGPNFVSHSARVQNGWKPILIYGGGPRFADVICSEGADIAAKAHHEWGQDYAAFETLVSRITAPNQTVVDPFCGSGTTLLAAHILGRNAIGCDIDEGHVKTAQERCGQ
jgi:23S rRNA G2445 N2-methylase RlmL